MSLFYCVTYDKSYSVLYKTRMLQVPFWLAVALLVILTLTSPSAKKNWRALQFDVNPDKPTTPSAIYPFRTQEARISAELLPGISYGAEITTTKRLPFVSLSLFYEKATFEWIKILDESVLPDVWFTLIPIVSPDLRKNTPENPTRFCPAGVPPRKHDIL